MTQNKSNITNPTLTEDDFSINQTTDVLTNKPIGYYIMLMKSHLTKEEAEQLKQQILTALDQYPKLKETVENYENSDWVQAIDYDKLKAENEELKKKADQYDKFLEYAEKTQRIHETRRGSEPAPFTPREGIISLIPMDFKEFVSYKNLQQENNQKDKTNRRFLSKIIFKENDCWGWKDYIDTNGYSQFSIDKLPIKAHRYSYELFRGEIPEGMYIDHLCRNRSCVNPEHMEIVTNVENVLRGEGVGAKNARMEYCKRGHKLIPENVYFNKKQNQRQCKLCSAIRSKNKRDSK